MILPGDVVYATDVRKPKKTLGAFEDARATSSEPFMVFVLGRQKKHHRIPNKEELIKFLSTMGMYAGDDIKALLGDEAWEKFDVAFVEKYS